MCCIWLAVSIWALGCMTIFVSLQDDERFDLREIIPLVFWPVTVMLGFIRALYEGLRD